MKRLPWGSLVLLLVCYASFGWYLSGLTAHPAWLSSTCEQIIVLGISQPAESQESRSSGSLSFDEPKTTMGETGVPESVKPTESVSTRSPLETRSESLNPKSTIPEPHTAGQTEKLPEARSESTSSKSTIPEPDSAERIEKSPTSAGEQEKERHSPSICDIFVKHNIHVAFLAIAWILVSSMAFISPLTSFSSFVSRWFKSDTVAFLTLVTIAGMAAVILYWLHVFLQILTILAADALARIDIQTVGLSGNQAFWILVLVSLTGLIAGWLFNVFLV